MAPEDVRSTQKAPKTWWARQDSNLKPSGYEPLALTIELRAPRRVLSRFFANVETTAAILKFESYAVSFQGALLREPGNP